MTHEPRLVRSLRALLYSRRTAALGTLQDGLPSVSFVPYAIDPGTGALVLHVSGLAAHTRQLETQPLASLLVTAAESEDAPVHALERATLQVRATTPERGSPAWESARTAYLQRFADVTFMTELGDFRFVLLQPLAGRHVAGFGAARDVAQDELQQLLHTPATS